MGSRNAGIVAVVVLSFAAAGDAETAKAKTAAKAVFTPASDLKWIDQPGVPVKTAVLWGDMTKGEHGALHRFPAGFSAPMHHHTCDHNAVVVSGKVTLGAEGEAAATLGPGAHFAFTGQKRHTTKCEEGEECLLFVDCAGAWDVLMDDKK